ncbi:ATP-binding protein [Streptomyces sp. wa1063]|uniref:ATP-binding protein n=1 Tax=Streptomyces sp. wa1063 TaxID=1828212 RepID=UPI000BF1EA9E|nr:ATP-binding protein [Streptomyces sp. wa1063]
MPKPAPASQHRPTKTPRAAIAPLVAVLSASAVAGSVTATLAPSEARGWVVAVVLTAWVVLAVALTVAHGVIRRARRSASDRGAEAERLTSSLAALETDTSHTADVALPALIQLVRGGVKATEALDRIPLPRSPRQRKLLHLLATTVEGQERQTVSLRTESTRVHDELGTENARLREELHALTSEVERFTRETLPGVVARLRDGESGATVQSEVYLPEQPLLRASVEAVLRELSLSERRALAATTASAKALSRVQAKSVSMLADLRSMQERHGEEVFGDLLKLDHSTSQLGLMTDRLALLMGGRPSRAWNRPIVMESILRGAVGRIAAYQRVRLHCSSSVSVSGFAAEGVMHLLAELMDNAANFSPPIDEVHVYVEERGTGIVVTIEDSGLKMADAAMRRAADSVAGRMTDLATLQGTRLGLAVVGRLALKHRISVNYRPSSRGGTGVVVLLPRHLIAQEPRENHPAPVQRAVAAPAPTPPPPASPAPAAPASPAPALAPEPTPVQPSPAPAPPPVTPAPLAPSLPETVAPVAGTPQDPFAPPPPAPAGDHLVVRPREPGRKSVRPAANSTPGGLPVRTPGRTMAESDRERGRHRGSPAPASPGDPRGDTPRTSPPRSAGQQFGAFRRGTKPTGTAGAPEAGAGEPEGRSEGPDGGSVPPTTAP